jgi:hypothetical protein
MAPPCSAPTGSDTNALLTILGREPSLMQRMLRLPARIVTSCPHPCSAPSLLCCLCAGGVRYASTRASCWHFGTGWLCARQLSGSEAQLFSALLVWCAAGVHQRGRPAGILRGQPWRITASLCTSSAAVVLLCFAAVARVHHRVQPVHFGTPGASLPHSALPLLLCCC